MEDGLDERVAEALVQARVGDQVRRDIRVAEGVGWPDRDPLVIGGEAVRRIAQVHPGSTGEELQLDQVLQPLVACRAGDQQPAWSRAHLDEFRVRLGRQRPSGCAEDRARDAASRA